MTRDQGTNDQAFRPDLHAARALAGIAKGLRVNWKQMGEVGRTIDRLLEDIRSTFGIASRIAIICSMEM